MFPWEAWMGLAFAELNWSPADFWSATLYELTAAYAFLLPEPVNKPFTDEERAILDGISRGEFVKRKGHG